MNIDNSERMQDRDSGWHSIGYDCKWKQSISRNILERAVMRESTLMPNLTQIAIEVCVNPIPAAAEGL